MSTTDMGFLARSKKLKKACLLPDRADEWHPRRYTDGNGVCPGQASSQFGDGMSRTEVVAAERVGQLEDCLALSILGGRKLVYSGVWLL